MNIAYPLARPARRPFFGTAARPAATAKRFSRRAATRPALRKPAENERPLNLYERYALPAGMLVFWAWFLIANGGRLKLAVLAAMQALIG